MKYLHILSGIILVLTLSCSTKKDIILYEKDLIPEGTAFHSKTNTTYIGSIYKQKIIAISPRGVVEDVIPATVFGDLSPIGIEMDNSKNVLWVNVALAPILNRTNSKEWKTTIMSFDMVDHTLIKKYDEISGDRIFLNDITVARYGDVYATESAGRTIYYIDHKTDKLAPFLELNDYHFPNGIVYFEPQHCLFVATNEGIVKVDIASKNADLIKCADGINATVIDGITVYDNYFIGHQSSKVSRFYFNKAITEIHKVDILDTGPEFDSSTTGEVGKGYYYYIVNSQIRSGISRPSNIVKPLDSLENIIIRKIKLK